MNLFRHLLQGKGKQVHVGMITLLPPLLTVPYDYGPKL